MNTNILKWIKKNAKGSIFFIVLLSIGSMVLSLITLQFSMESKNIIDIATKVSDNDFSTACIRIIVFLALMLIVQIAINFLNVHASSRFEINLKNNIFKAMINKDYLKVSAYHSGDLINRINSDVGAIVTGIMTIVPKFILFVTSIVGAFFYLCRIDATLALIILAIGPFVLIGSRLYSKKYKELHKKCRDAEGKTHSFMLEMLQNLLVVKSFSNEDTVTQKANALQKISYKLRVYRTKISIIAHVGIFIVFNAGFYFALAYCAYKLSKNLMTYGDVIAITQLVNQIQSPFRNMSGLVPQFFGVIASIERLQELEAISDEEKTGNEVDISSYNQMEEIVFDNVKFSYSEDSFVSGINMRIKKGEFAVVAGESGAGKSTALKLLLGILKPDEGKIYLTLKDGQKEELGSNSRKLFSYVPQGNLILSGTIRENVTFANGDVSEEKIVEALKISCIWDFINTLDNGLDTVIGEKGLGLSEGQAQRISIARAILGDAPILLLDESTSALDSKTEEELLKSIKSLTDKTVIIVSHKQAAFDFCDKVVYVEKNTD